MDQFGEFRASELYCPKCRRATPVYEKLLLVLPGMDLYDLRCRQCGTSVGQREAKAPGLAAQMKVPPAAPPRPAVKRVAAGPRVSRGALPPRR